MKNEKQNRVICLMDGGCVYVLPLGPKPGKTLWSRRQGMQIHEAQCVNHNDETIVPYRQRL